MVRSVLTSSRPRWGSYRRPNEPSQSFSQSWNDFPNIIHPAGAPPFFLLGYEGEQKLLKRWTETYGRPVFTNGTTQVNALNAFKAKSFVGVSYFPGEINKSYAR